MTLQDGFIRIAAATPAVVVADPMKNRENIDALWAQAEAQSASIVVFPQLCLTGATCGDLFAQPPLADKAWESLMWLCARSVNHQALAVIGLPIVWGQQRFDCAAVVQAGRVLGIVPRGHVGGTVGSGRFFTSGQGLSDWVRLPDGSKIPIGDDLLFYARNQPDFVFGVEVGADAEVPIPPAARLALAGATLILQPAADAEWAGQDRRVQLSLQAQSQRLRCGIVRAQAGEGESTTDLVYAGGSVIAEDGELIAQAEPFSTGLLVSEIDLTRLNSGRMRAGWAGGDREEFRWISFTANAAEMTLTRVFPAEPFIPKDASLLQEHCGRIIRLQAEGLRKRMLHVGSKSAVLALSGGLDSTLALLVIREAFALMGLPRENILAVSLPCFGTSGRTRDNAAVLARETEVTFREIPISQSVTQHLQDIGHDGSHDLTYENAQARERTQVVMDLAGMTGGLMIGTGDLSELSLGFTTYNGDHMSFYSVNASVPKTLIRHVVRTAAMSSPDGLKAVLLDILDTPVSPELLPPHEGAIAQQTESIVGPYELHDFFLYYMLQYGYSPVKIYRLASYVFAGVYAPDVILGWLKLFMRRFFAQQYKRSCAPDGPKVTELSLSPRGAWMMPSDASARVWLDELESL